MGSRRKRRIRMPSGTNLYIGIMLSLRNDGQGQTAPNQTKTALEYIRYIYQNVPAGLTHSAAYQSSAV